jgi:hypothetical protein
MSVVYRIGVGNDNYPSVDEAIEAPVIESLTFDSEVDKFDTATKTFDEEI